MDDYQDLKQRLDAAEQALASERARIARAVGMIDDWDSFGGPGSDCERIFGEQLVKVSFVVAKMREALR